MAKGPLAREMDRYRAEHGNLSWQAMARRLRTSVALLQSISERGYCTPRIAKKIERASRGELPAWLLLGLQEAPQDRRQSG